MKDQVQDEVVEDHQDPKGQDDQDDQSSKKHSEKTDDKGQKKTIKPKGKLTKLVKVYVSDKYTKPPPSLPAGAKLICC